MERLNLNKVRNCYLLKTTGKHPQVLQIFYNVTEKEKPELYLLERDKIFTLHKIAFNE